MEIGHEVFSTVILSLPLIQEGQLSVSGERMCTILVTLRKHAYLNTLKNSQPKTESFSDKNSDIFHISAQNIDCGYMLEPP